MYAYREFYGGLNALQASWQRFEAQETDRRRTQAHNAEIIRGTLHHSEKTRADAKLTCKTEMQNWAKLGKTQIQHSCQTRSGSMHRLSKS